MQKKKYKKPLFFKKSKAAKELEEYDEFSETEDYRPHRKFKSSPSRMKKSSKYKSEYEYSGFEDEYGVSQVQFYNSEIFDKDDGMSEYTTGEGEGLFYKQKPRRSKRMQPIAESEYLDETRRGRRMQPIAETEYFDESDSDFYVCDSGNKRQDYFSRYPYEQLYEEEQLRHRLVQSPNHYKRKGIPSELDMRRRPRSRELSKRPLGRKRYVIEEDEDNYERKPHGKYVVEGERRNPYHQNMEEQIYLSRLPIGHKAFRYEKESALEEEESEVEEEEGTEEEMQQKPQFQVYTANAEESQNMFQQRRRPPSREEVLSVLEYDESEVPLVNLSSANNPTTQSDSSAIVYLPVKFTEKRIETSLGKNRIIHAESLLNSLKTKAEKPLQRDQQVFVAQQQITGNVFQQAQQKPTDHGLAVYTVASHHSVAEKKPSLVSRLMSKRNAKNKSDYPVNKSYIKVVPFKATDKDSKTSLRSARKVKSNQSLIGKSKSVNPKGSKSFCKLKKKTKDLPPPWAKSGSQLVSVTELSPENEQKPLHEFAKSNTRDTVNSHESGRPTVKSGLPNNNRPQPLTSSFLKRSQSVTSVKGGPTLPRGNVGQTSPTRQPALEVSSIQTQLSRQPTLLMGQSKDKESVAKSRKTANDRVSLTSKQPTIDRHNSKNDVTQSKKDLNQLGKQNSILNMTHSDSYGKTKNKSPDTSNIQELELINAEPNLRSSPSKKRFNAAKTKSVLSLFKRQKSKAKASRSQDLTLQHESIVHTSPPSATKSTLSMSGKNQSKRDKKRGRSKTTQKSQSQARIHEELNIWNYVHFDYWVFVTLYEVCQFFLGYTIHRVVMDGLILSKQHEEN